MPESWVASSGSTYLHVSLTKPPKRSNPESRYRGWTKSWRRNVWRWTLLTDMQFLSNIAFEVLLWPCDTFVTHWRRVKASLESTMKASTILLGLCTSMTTLMIRTSNTPSPQAFPYLEKHNVSRRKLTCIFNHHPVALVPSLQIFHWKPPTQRSLQSTLMVPSTVTSSHLALRLNLPNCRL